MRRGDRKIEKGRIWKGEKSEHMGEREEPGVGTNGYAMGRKRRKIRK